MDAMYWGMSAFVLLNIVAFYHVYAAYRDLRRVNPSEAISFLVMGRYARREMFTESGWRHRQLAVVFHLAGWAVGIAFFLFS